MKKKYSKLVLNQSCLQEGRFSCTADACVYIMSVKCERRAAFASVQESHGLRTALQVMKNKVEVYEWWRNIPKLVLFSNEACCYIGGYVASQHNSYQYVEKIFKISEEPLRSIKVGVWCAMSAVSSGFTSNPISLLATTKASVFSPLVCMLLPNTLT